MRSRAFTLSVLILAALATPAFATIQFSYCNFGCTANNNNAGMTYAAFQAVTSGLTFPVSPITFDSANLSGGIYTDPTTGAIFTGFNPASEALSVVSTALAQPGSIGQYHSIQIDLPLNTYAVAMFVSSVSGSSNPWESLTTTPTLFNGGAVDYQLNISSSSASVFFGLVSTTPISRLFIGNLYSGNSPIRILNFETGQNLPVTETPEASTLAMIGSGLLLVRFLRRPALRRLAQRPW